jgi:large subunit ribosomal protein L6
MSEVQVRNSRLGKRPVDVPKGVTVNLSGSTIDIQGPKGKLKQVLPTGVIAKKRRRVSCGNS